MEVLSADYVIGGAALAAIALRNTGAGSSSSPAELAAYYAAAGGDKGADVGVTGSVNGQEVQISVRPIGHGFFLRSDAAVAFDAMDRAAAADGVVLIIDSAWRSKAEQQQLRDLYEAGLGPQAAPAGYSNHEGGIAVDLSTMAGSNAAFTWLNLNAGHFFFRRTVDGEPWHWEYRP